MGRWGQAIVKPELEKVGCGAPPFGDAGFDRRHRHLGKAARDKRGEDHAERILLVIEGRAGEHEAGAAGNDLRPRCEAGIGWLEAEAIPAFDGPDLLAEEASQGEEALRLAFVNDASMENPHGVGGKRRRYKEASRFEVESWVHRYSDPMRPLAHPFARILAVSRSCSLAYI